jgi:hypothetical protein
MEKSTSGNTQPEVGWPYDIISGLPEITGPDRVDQVAESITRTTIAESALTTKCRLMDDLFQQHKLSRLEFDIPGVGFYSNAQVPLAHVKKWSSTDDRLLEPMKVCWSWAHGKFERELQQKISKPINIHLTMDKIPGFNYRIKPKENVVLSRLLVDIRDLDDAISQLTCEANRFYILYCLRSS